MKKTPKDDARYAFHWLVADNWWVVDDDDVQSDVSCTECKRELSIPKSLPLSEPILMLSRLLFVAAAST